MIIEKLTLENFRQFKTKQEIEFSLKKDSNITLILGDNTSGKTTILQAFLWCLYGRTEFKSKHQMYNIEHANEMKNNSRSIIEVKINLKHQGRNYEVIRRQNIKKINGVTKLDGVSVLSINEKKESGETKPSSETSYESFIQEILPEELSSYFFYDTERFGNISTKKDLKESVKGLLGISVLENAIAHIGTRHRSGTVLWKINQEISQKSTDELKELNHKQEEHEKNINKKEKEIKQLTDEENKYINFIEKDETTLKNMEETVKLQEQRDTLKKYLDKIEKNYENEKKSISSTIGINPVNFFATPLINTVLEELKQSDFEEKGIRDMNANSIEDIINRGVCVCGTKIDKDTEPYNELIDTLKYLPPQSISTQIKQFISMLEVTKNSSKTHYNSVLEKHTKILEVEQDIANVDDEYRKVSDRIIETVDGRSIEERIKKNKSHLKSLQTQLIHLNRDIEDLKEHIKKTQIRYNDLLAQNERNQEKITLLKYGDEVLNWLTNDLNKRQSEIKEELKDKVSYYFQKIYHGNRFVEIDESYNVTLTSGEGKHITDESAGLETVKNFSFITGLVDLAKNKLMEEVDLSNEYPLVLDAPFSNVDESHVVNISKVLPTVARQLILIVMAKDWNYAEESLNYRVGKRYVLEKISETNTIIKEES